MQRIRHALVVFVMLLITACASSAPASRSTLSAVDTASGGGAPIWFETRLYFGVGPADGHSAADDEARWRRFLDDVVTPRFPAGLSVVDVYGQWKEPGEASPERLRSKELLIIHRNTPADRAGIEAIRDAWKQRTGDHSVLRVTQAVDASF
ncbi:DUF3574 domain-containing protein [Dyella terrae]|uniref:DUF3574 domain-containing protein n=3 Tax=Rhodanobacteraceae TaxID=1775411 RepID=A0A4R0Z2Y1_9GAMM|nr:DUF3574 domain-containing protein [Dyella terrae]TCI12670.1 DUF3574 domain-containing protein [Dyella soli]